MFDKDQYPNLHVDKAFIDTLSSINESGNLPLTEEMVNKAQELKEKITQETYVGSPNNDIIEAYREVAPQSNKYDQNMFKRFERLVYQ